jgi:hypothetical protein
MRMCGASTWEKDLACNQASMMLRPQRLLDRKTGYPPRARLPGTQDFAG